MPQNAPQQYGSGGTYGYQVPYNPYMPQTQQIPQAQQMPQNQQVPQTQQMPAFPVPPQMPPQQMPQAPRPLIARIIELNRGKLITVHMTFENNSEWNARIFKGIIEEAGRDHFVLHDLTTGQRHLLPTINFDFATFDEPLEYDALPFFAS